MCISIQEAHLVIFVYNGKLIKFSFKDASSLARVVHMYFTNCPLFFNYIF